MAEQHPRLQHDSLDGSTVVHEFLLMRPGWEMDNTGWVTKDGRLWLTSHGGPPYECSRIEILKELTRTTRSAAEIAKALALAHEATGTGGWTEYLIDDLHRR